METEPATCWQSSKVNPFNVLIYDKCFFLQLINVLTCFCYGWAVQFDQRGQWQFLDVFFSNWPQMFLVVQGSTQVLSSVSGFLPLFGGWFHSVNTTSGNWLFCCCMYCSRDGECVTHYSHTIPRKNNTTLPRLGQTLHKSVFHKMFKNCQHFSHSAKTWWTLYTSHAPGM